LHRFGLQSSLGDGLEPFLFAPTVILPTMPQPKLYQFSVTIGESCARQFITFQDLAAKLKMDVVQLMRECNAKVPPSRPLVKGVAKQLGIDEALLERLAEEVRRDLGAK
jgi:hypothetical protein